MAEAAIKTGEALSLAVAAALDRKALDLVTLDLSELGSITDYFLICHGRSNRQVQAIADRVLRVLKKAGVRPSHVEGHAAAEWVLLDYVDFVVHVFLEDRRKYYSLEKLWSDAPRLAIVPGPLPTEGDAPPAPF